jgi:hypothetical protein
MLYKHFVLIAISSSHAISAGSSERGAETAKLARKPKIA